MFRLKVGCMFTEEFFCKHMSIIAHIFYVKKIFKEEKFQSRQSTVAEKFFEMGYAEQADTNKIFFFFTPMLVG